MYNDRNKTLDWKARKILKLVHSDLAGPIQPLRKEGYRYVINFIDDYSGFITFHFLKHKSDTLLAIKKYLADITPQGHVKCLRTDNGTEFTSETFQWLLVDNQIKHQNVSPLFTIPEWGCWTLMEDLIIYGEVSTYWVKIASKFVDLCIDEYSIY